MKKDILATVPLDDLITTILGLERKGSVAIPHVIAEVINFHVKNSTSFYVQFNDHDGKPLKFPILWSYDEWYNSSQNYYRAKAYAHKERVASWIMNANVKIVAKAYMKWTEIDDEKLAFTQARFMLEKKRIKTMAIMGVTKLITKEEELQ